MANNLDIEGAVYRDFKAYFENPGEGINAVTNVKNLYDQISKNNALGCFIGVAYTEEALKNQSPFVTASGRYRTTVNIVLKTDAAKDKLSAVLRAKVKAVRELMNRENLATTLTNISFDQTYKTVIHGSSEAGNDGKIRTHEFSYTIIHKVSK